MVAWLVALLLVAELLRNTGRFTMADVLSFRLNERPVRTAAAISTLTVSLFYLLAQMAGAGGLVALLLDISSRAGQSIVIVVVGVLMIIYVLIGGMKGTTWVQIIKAVLLIAGAALMTIMVLAKVGLNVSDLLGQAQSKIATSSDPAVAARDVLAPGAKYGGSTTTKIDFLSLAIAPGPGHRRPAARVDALLHRADRQGGAALGGLGDQPDRCLLPVHTGPGLRRRGHRRTRQDPRRGGQGERRRAAAGPGTGRHDSARRDLRRCLRDDPRRRRRLAITASASFAHDIYASVIKRGYCSSEEQVRVRGSPSSSWASSASCWASSPTARTSPFLVALAFAVAASANLPTILYSLYWRRFNTRGALWSMYGGLISAIVLIVFSRRCRAPRRR